MNIGIIVGSTRHGRVTDRLAKWVTNAAKQQYEEYEWMTIDLQAFDLPLFDESKSPQGNPHREVNEEVASYLAAMDPMDAFIVVTPEYNHALPAALKNALDLLDYQLVKKPVAIVSHGVVGGARANEQVRLIVNSSLGAVPIPASLTFFGKVAELIDDNGNLVNGQEMNQQKLSGLLEQLLWYASALKVAREA